MLPPLPPLPLPLLALLALVPCADALLQGDLEMPTACTFGGGGGGATAVMQKDWVLVVVRPGEAGNEQR